MDYPVVRRFYSEIQANIYFLKLKNSGIRCFLSNENISTILPLSNGGFMLHVSKEQLEEAEQLMIKLDQEVQSSAINEDFREATLEDIHYMKQVEEYNQKLEHTTINMSNITMVIILLFCVTILIVIINYFLVIK